MAKDKQKQGPEKSGKEVAQTQTKPVSVSRPFFDEMDEWFDEMQRHWLSPRLFARGWPDLKPAFGDRIPKVDVIDREDEICVRAELPGVDKDHLTVTLHDNILTIQTSMEKEEHDEEGRYHRRELVKSEFQRSLQLPAPVDSDKAKSSFKDGILELTLPKLAGYKPKHIKVE